MQNYKSAGVDISAGDAASKIAFAFAQKTFASRKNLIGAPLSAAGGFAGLLDFGKFCVAQCCDTVGTKIDLAAKLNYFDQLGADLLAMVADDAVCLGAEVVAVTNTFEIAKIDPVKIEKMMRSLSEICTAQKVVISGGEIAEVGAKIKNASWGADAIGIVAPEKIIDKKNVAPGDAIISLREKSFRCNGYSLIRKILAENWDENLARKCLRGSRVFHDAILKLHGRFGEKPRVKISAIAHVTGGGIPGNLKRILPKNCGAVLENLFAPPDFFGEIQTLGKIPAREFYEVFNGGNGMLVVLPKSEIGAALEILKSAQIDAQIAGEIVADENEKIILRNFSADGSEKFLEF
jgi:phosphoribosylformylglycinamidine cyclo-ligase